MTNETAGKILRSDSTMALTGERLRQLLHANALKRKQKRKSNRHSDGTTGEEDRDDEDEEETGDKGRKNLEKGVGDGQYLGCYAIASKGCIGKEKWIKPFSYEVQDGKDTSEATTHTACVTEDLAFKRLQRHELPPGVKAPRSASLNIYVFSKELTELILRKSSGVPLRRTSKRAEETPVLRTKRSEGNNHNRVMNTAPPIPPKPENLLNQPPSLKIRGARGSSDPQKGNTDSSKSSTETHSGITDNGVLEGEISRTDPGQQEPPLPLPPRKNRPRPVVASPGLPETTAEILEIVKEEGNSTIRKTASDKISSKSDDEENHYEPVESQKPSTKNDGGLIQTHAQIQIESSQEEIKELHSMEETQESDSVFDGRSPDDTCNDLNNKSIRNGGDPKLILTQKSCESDKTPMSQPSSLPSDRRPMSDSALPSEIVLPQILNPHDPDDTTDSDSGETDTYEDIDFSGRNRGESSRGSCGYDRVADDRLTDSSWMVLHRDDIVIVENGEVCRIPDKKDASSEETMIKEPSSQDGNSDRLLSDDFTGFIGTSLAYNKDGNAIYIPSEKLKVYGDPRGEPWFYPLELSSREATLFLRSEQQEGCFLVYKPAPGSSSAAYNLSLSRGNGDVLHYHILEGPEGGITIEGHNHSFLNLGDLVDYFKRNKSTLATRLRRPLKEARFPITAGYHYDLAYELDRDRLSLTGNIIGKGNFGVVCSGMYCSTPVAVKVLQGTEASLEDEDDFIEEARVLMMLKHEQLVRIIGVSSSTRPFFLVTEFIQHGSLKECLRNGRIPTDNPDLFADICLQMLTAVSYLESVKYVLHRDIAARNFLVADIRRVKLADFGRARFVNDDNYQAPRTEKISIKWAAPEVLLEFRYSTKSDVWATGVAMWEVYSGGERPYESLSAEQTAVYVTEGGRLARPPLCSEEVYASVRRCWRRSSSSRPSATTLHQAILENRRAAICRRNQKKLDAANQVKITISPSRHAPSAKPFLTPTLKKKSLDVDTGSTKQRFSAIRDVFLTSSFRENLSQKNSNSPERLPTSSSSENVSSLSNTPDSRAVQKIRSSFRKLISNKVRKSSKTKLDYIENQEKPRRPTVTQL